MNSSTRPSRRSFTGERSERFRSREIIGTAQGQDVMIIGYRQVEVTRMPVYRKAEEPYGCGWVGRASLPTLEHYVDNNSTPTVASNLLKANAMLSWHVSCQRAKCFKPLLCSNSLTNPSAKGSRLPGLKAESVPVTSPPSVAQSLHNNTTRHPERGGRNMRTWL